MRWSVVRIASEYMNELERYRLCYWVQPRATGGSRMDRDIPSIFANHRLSTWQFSIFSISQNSSKPGRCFAIHGFVRRCIPKVNPLRQPYHLRQNGRKASTPYSQSETSAPEVDLQPSLRLCFVRCYCGLLCKIMQKDRADSNRILIHIFHGYLNRPSLGNMNDIGQSLLRRYPGLVIVFAQPCR